MELKFGESLDPIFLGGYPTINAIVTLLWAQHATEDATEVDGERSRCSGPKYCKKKFAFALSKLC